MIQIITKDVETYKKKIASKEIRVVEFNEYESFDLYDINIIDLTSRNIWICDSSSIGYLNDKNDLNTLKKSISTCNKKVVILFPLNLDFRYHYDSYDRKYRKSTQLKVIKDNICNFVSDYIYGQKLEIEYERGITKIDGIIYNSDFYFEEGKGIILCEGSKKANTVKLSDNIVVSTLNIFDKLTDTENEKSLYVFLNKIEFLENKEIIPEWVDDISFYDDHIYKKHIKESEEKIERLKNVIDENEKKLKENLKYKSILYSSGNTLSKEVNEILRQIFNLTEEFIDTFEEDFNFKFKSTVFIVETKGLNNEVSGKNVSDAFSHLVIYEDELENKGTLEETKCLFFVASERSKKPQERNKIKERQIILAKRNKTLIIETTTLYKLFEDFLKKEISTEDIYKLFKENVGLLEYKKLNINSII